MNREEGRLEGISQGIGALITACQELNIPEEDTLTKVIQKFSLTSNEAEEYTQQHWKKRRN